MHTTVSPLKRLQRNTDQQHLLALLSFGVDLAPLTKEINKVRHYVFADQDNIDFDTHGKADWTTILGVAWVIHTVILPVRVGITAIFTPTVAKIFQKRGWTLKLPKIR
ncbi:hypothetical protein HDV06_003073 [Boothiomyces sp. JEL0866]|nr:hypothetical protein HDV06_000517 [Boothiomyces sp. JEL0866]KAJ3322353.1 hypothetical protein HDV06_003073 [Boothiomyces sp. JEL0866]